MDRLRADATALTHDMVAMRHDLHQHPEIGLHLPRTQGAVLASLDGLPLEITTGTSCTSVTAVLRGTAPRSEDRPAILLRGDMDALPVQETTGLDFASQVDGAMHACGHDLHTAMLAGAARLLSAHRHHLAGDVVFMFQPGEEGLDGAAHMIAEGVLDAAGSRVRRAYGIHVMSATLPRHHFTTREGTMMAASAALDVVVHGDGGHGSAPHRAKDPIPVAAEMITALQTMITRQFDVFDPVVLTVGSFHAGTKRNIIAPRARLEATVRSFTAGTMQRVQAGCRRLCESIAAAHGLTVDVHFGGEYPATVNDPAESRFATEVVTDLFGTDRFVPMSQPDTGSEDFSRVLEAVPGCYVFLGAGPAGREHDAPDNHSSDATFDDAVLVDGCLLHATLAWRSLRSRVVAGPRPGALRPAQDRSGRI